VATKTPPSDPPARSTRWEVGPIHQCRTPGDTSGTIPFRLETARQERVGSRHTRIDASAPRNTRPSVKPTLLHCLPVDPLRSRSRDETASGGHSDGSQPTETGEVPIHDRTGNDSDRRVRCSSCDDLLGSCRSDNVFTYCVLLRLLSLRLARSSATPAASGAEAWLPGGRAVTADALKATADDGGRLRGDRYGTSAHVVNFTTS